jgi:hypothetical protein
MSGPMIVFLGGAILVAYLAYDWYRYRMRIRKRKGGEEGKEKRRLNYDWKIWAMIGFVVVLALLYARPITRVSEQNPEGVTGHAYGVALYVLIIGITWAMRAAGKAKISQRMLVNDEVAELVVAFRSVFRVRPTVFSALEEANRKIEPPVGTAVSHAVTTFYVTSLPRRALDELRARVENPYMDQLIYILERGEDAKHEDILSALEGLIARLRRARDLRDQSEVNLTVINGQTRIIQMIAIAAVLLVGIIPAFRVAYENIPGQLLFFGIASVGVGTSWYIDGKASQLKERVL